MRQPWQTSKARRASFVRSSASQNRQSFGSFAGGCSGFGLIFFTGSLARARIPPLPVMGERGRGVWDSAQRREHLLEAARVALLGLRERLEPLGDVVEALFARGLRHARVHVLVLVRLAGDRGLEVLLGVADGQSRRGITDLLEVIEVTVGVPRLSVGSLLEVA